jgi:hypothetical protein
MATPGTTERLIELGPWPLGANNLALETSVPRRSFRRGVNVDVTDDGRVVRRDGTTRVIEGDDVRSLFGYGARGFFQDGDTLYGFEVVNGVETEVVGLFTGLAAGARLAHCMVEPDIFVSDGVQTLRIAPDNTVSPWTVQTAPSPVLSVLSSGGSLPPGRYRVAVAYKMPSGEEGPLSDWETIEIEQGQGIRIALTHVLAGARTAIYVTRPNGTELLHLSTVPQVPAVNLLNISRLGRPAVTQHLDPMPPGEFAALWNGRLLVASGRFVYWSEPNHYSLTNLAYNYLEFAAPVSGLAAVEVGAGFYVGQSDRTYFVAGADPADAALSVAYPAGIVAGTVHMVPGARLPLEAPPSTPVPAWLASNGVFCAGLEDGSILPLTETRYAARTGQSGASLFVQKSGRSRLVTTVRDSQENTFAMTDQFTAEVVRISTP